MALRSLQEDSQVLMWYAAEKREPRLNFGLLLGVHIYSFWQAGHCICLLHPLHCGQGASCPSPSESSPLQLSEYPSCRTIMQTQYTPFHCRALTLRLSSSQESYLTSGQLPRRAGGRFGNASARPPRVSSRLRPQDSPEAGVRCCNRLIATCFNVFLLHVA